MMAMLFVYVKRERRSQTFSHYIYSVKDKHINQMIICTSYS